MSTTTACPFGISIFRPKAKAMTLPLNISPPLAFRSSSSYSIIATSRLNTSQPFLGMVSTLPKSQSHITRSTNIQSTTDGNKKTNKSKDTNEGESVEIEEEMPWIQDKAMDLVEFTGSVTQTIPGPRVGSTSLPWILAIPLAYASITFVFAFVRTVQKLSSPRTKRSRLVNKNAELCKSIDELFHEGRDQVTSDALEHLVKKTGFGIDEILRKYIRYSLNEKPFNTDLISNLIELRKASGLNHTQIADILNEISRRIVRDKGPVVMNVSGYTEKGFKRKLAVQALFGKVFYLSELPDFSSRGSSLVVKEIFGVTDDDADKLRLHMLSEAGDMDLLEQMVDDSDPEEPTEGLFDAP